MGGIWRAQARARRWAGQRTRAQQTGQKRVVLSSVGYWHAASRSEASPPAASREPRLRGLKVSPTKGDAKPPSHCSPLFAALEPTRDATPRGLEKDRLGSAYFE